MHRCPQTGRFLPNWLFDPFDPRGWPEPLPYRTIWLNPEANLFCVVGNDDYDWAMQWTWRATANSPGLKFYATPSQNGKNKYGYYVKQRDLFEDRRL